MYCVNEIISPCTRWTGIVPLSILEISNTWLMRLKRLSAFCRIISGPSFAQRFGSSAISLDIPMMVVNGVLIHV